MPIVSVREISPVFQTEQYLACRKSPGFQTARWRICDSFRKNLTEVVTLKPTLYLQVVKMGGRSLVTWQMSMQHPLVVYSHLPPARTAPQPPFRKRTAPEPGRFSPQRSESSSYLQPMARTSRQLLHLLVLVGTRSR